MNKLADLVTEQKIRELAIPSNLRLGEEIVKHGAIEMIEETDDHVICKVQASEGEKRRVELDIEPPHTLIWKCSCAGELGTFCKHCVAAALKVARGKER